MVDTFFTALATLLTFQHMTALSTGVVLGLVVGVLPGLGGIVGLSLLLPFLYGMEATHALAMMVGVLAVIPTSDTFASILMGIPGSTASQATVLDGFPLAKKGEAARALAAAFAASMVGGVFGALVLTAFVVIARPVILSFGTSELFALTIFGLSMVGVLAGTSLTKGIATAALGLVFGMVGDAPATGEYRMEFGSLYLIDGVPLVIVALGLFAVPEIVDLLRSQSSIAGSTHTLGKGWRQGLRDTWACRWLVLRCSGLGTLIGAMPGLGGSVVDWIAYGHVVQMSKDRSEFGKGDIRGVIAPESANNACAGGTLIPTLLFGIPGSGATAVFLSALILIGVQPGPSMADPARDLDLTYTVVWSLAVASVLGTALCIALAPYIARLTTIPYALIAPFMIMIVSFAAFQATRSLQDMIALLVMGAIGIFLRRFGWPRPAFLIGFALATQSERYLYQAVQFSGWGFMGRPLVLLIIAVTVLSIWLSVRKRPGEAVAAVHTEGSSALAGPGQVWPQVAFAAATTAAFAFAVVSGLSVSLLAAIFPIAIGLVGMVASGFVLLPLLRGRLTTSANFDAELAPRENDVRGGAWAMLGWLAAFVAAIALLGFFAALIVFFVVFLRVMARISWARIALLTGVACAFMLMLIRALNLVLPGGLLQAYFDLPWPFR
ncbi:tripartite tricarboxylate transporter permease [Pelagibius sp. 7325]|uniref:tripartite tricarboxylate transporter permease n=1 Tax=Pelagibius sp. 7325 TaxID=3131994 RepID=UPI0030ECD2DB